MIRKVKFDEIKAMYSDLIKKDFSEIIKFKTKVDLLGELIDSSYFFKKKEGMLKAIKIFKELQSSKIPPDQYTRLFYYGGNAYSDLDTFLNKGKSSIWNWDRELIEKEIISYRLALKEKYLINVEDNLKCQIYTNLGNLFSDIGRVIEAQNCWRKALKINSKFPMALCNKGKGFFEYSKMLYDRNHRNIFLKLAYKLIKPGLKGDLAPDARNHFQEIIDFICKISPSHYLRGDFKFKEYSLGRSKKEKYYRKWCLQNCLFLNPLNEIGNYTAFAHDIISTPPMKISDKNDLCPIYQGFFSHIKQEFNTARYLLYLGLNDLGDKFLNKGLHLVDTLDYPEYGVNIEFTKIAFRLFYSIFDKIAFFINEYYDLRIPKDKVTLKKIWGTFDKTQNRLVIRKEFKERENLALRGLYWLSKDIFYESGHYRESLEPEAKKIAEIRNHLEHKYLKIHYIFTENSPKKIESNFFDSLSFSIQRLDFESKTMKLAKLAREAIIYSLLSIHINEKVDRKKLKEDEMIIDMPIFEYEF